MAKGKTTDKASATEDAALKQRRLDSERAQRQAEEGTGAERDKGYAGSGDATGDQGNYNTDPSQASRDQQQNQEAGRPLNDDAKK